MLQCSKEEALVRLFYNISGFLSLLLLFYFLLSSCLAKFLDLISNLSIFQRSPAWYEFSDEEEEEEEGVRPRDDRNVYYHVADVQQGDLVADVIHGGQALLFYSGDGDGRQCGTELGEGDEYREQMVGEETDGDNSNEQYSAQDSFCNGGLESERENGSGSGVEEEADSDPQPNFCTNELRTTSEACEDRHPNKESAKDIGDNEEKCFHLKNAKDEGTQMSMSKGRNGRSCAFEPTYVDTNKKFGALERDSDDAGEIYGDSCTVGSTSKSSSEWRSSINCRESGTDDPFSSSSRRSCPKWESYTVFQKYDEEMLFLDRISAQKLHETESLRSIQVCPRSISERIVHKISTMNKKPSDIRHNPYGELEAAYVAQICLTWEALNWNYKNFQSNRATRADFDHGCPAHVAQQFQQFQVLLQRYVENEPYEHGRRPEVYARVRLLAPKLLQVPEYRDSEDDQKEEGFRSRISSAAFAKIIEDGIQIFMNFLKADRERPCQKVKAFFRRKRRGGVDPALITLMKKVNHKKKMKLKDLRRAWKCLRKRKLSVVEEMEILMALIDLKLVSRVLRMADLTEEQLHWCEGKMSRVRISQGKLQRDSSPLFFPAH